VRDRIGAVLQLLFSRGPEREISKHWLLRSSGSLDRKFRETGGYIFSEREDFLQVEISDQIFLWPRNASKEMVLQLLSELLTPTHPHQYQYGETKIEPEDIVLDIGACEGAFTAFVSARCKKVIAVEPSKVMCKLMTKLFEIRNEPCPQIFNCLLGSQPGNAYFVDNLWNPGASMIASESTPGAYEIEVRTIDQIVETLPEKPTFLKCDAEGAEMQIFSGGKEFLRESHPKLAITTYHNVGDYREMYEFLKSLGYRVAGKGFLYTNRSLRPMMIHAW